MNLVGVSIVFHHLKCLGVALLSGDEHWREAVLVRRLEVGAELCEKLHRLRVAVEGRDVQWRGAVLVRRLDVGAELCENL